MNQPRQPQQPPPQTYMRDTGQGRQIECCIHCNNPIPRPHSYQGPDNQIYLKKWCPYCGNVIGIKGPFRSHQEANPVVFK